MIILIILFLIIFVIPVIGLIIGFPFILLGAKRADKIKKERKVEEESRRGKELDERIRSFTM